MHGWNLVMHGRLHNFDDDEKGIVDKLAMSTQSCILDQWLYSHCAISIQNDSCIFFKFFDILAFFSYVKAMRTNDMNSNIFF